MVEHIGGDAADPADVIDDAAVVGQDFAEVHAAVAPFAKASIGSEQTGIGGQEGEASTFRHAGWWSLAMVLVQNGFGCEEFQLAGSSGHEHEDDIFGFGWQEAGACSHGAVCGCGITGQEIREGDGPE
ncbi:hypothetical protein LBMAG46_00440 [Planctomycetia bacterium]|nr:hypothetical protein LBMAG46_00440 [Planctomycetia bacterium]